MGGGGSSSKNYTYNTIDVKPVTNVEIDTEEIAKAIKDGSLEEKEAIIETTKLKAVLAKAGLDLEKQKQAQEFFKDEKTRNQLALLTVIIGSSYIYKHLKKGKK
ncbi:hypothetical protein AMRN_1418 [Malaciobacter marinus]|uniref:Uncharacterized protein n=1 Tax=Malaciobacter marinus TaxID=505249 RepID=A0A347TKM6_9BACT|nr:hypothetical protein [Malaciobacter marinus]AXX87154.1 hypothetical protein AMRN_1418 [Malaciobacter marinus]PHO14817.1 hypothetical protein CPH92_09530 [Malaciobacter marinus]